MKLASGNVQFQFAPGSPKFDFDQESDYLVPPLGIQQKKRGGREQTSEERGEEGVRE